MHFESPPSLPPQSPESHLQDAYQQVLKTSVTPENIQFFFDITIDKLVAITEQAVTHYQKLHPNTPLTQKALEDAAYQTLSLPDIEIALNAITERGEIMMRLKYFIQQETELESSVFIPPIPGKYDGIIPGSGVGKEYKPLIPRLLTLLYILENDLDQKVTQEDDHPIVTITQGIVTDHMLRQHPYFRVMIHPFDRVVYLCEEAGNASYIFDTRTLPLDLAQVDRMDKEALNAFIQVRPDTGKRLIQGATWRERMIRYLTQDFCVDEVATSNTLKPQSDFVSKAEVLKKKDGWESASQLLNVLESSNVTIKTYAEQFRGTHPEWFEVQRTGSNQAEHYHPELVQKLREHFLSVPKQREGWKSAGQLQKELGFGSKAYAEQFRTIHPEWFEVQRIGKVQAEHYHPELVQKLREHFLSIPQKKDGWENASQLWSILESSNVTIKTYAEQFRITHPEWFEMQKIGPHQAEYYHPELVQKIREHFLSMSQKKEGWRSIGQLRDELGGARKTIRAYVEPFRVTHPEWFGVQRAGSNQAEYYHPELVQKIREHFLSIPQKNDGWESAHQLGIKYGVELTKIKSRVEQFRATHPEWFEIQKIRGVPVECYHPTLIEKLRYLAIPKKKNGWESASQLQGMLQGDHRAIKIYAEQFRETHPEWFEVQRAGSSQAEHYHPDLVAILRERFPQRVPREKSE